MSTPRPSSPPPPAHPTSSRTPPTSPSKRPAASSSSSSYGFTSPKSPRTADASSIASVRKMFQGVSQSDEEEESEEEEVILLGKLARDRDESKKNGETLASPPKLRSTSTHSTNTVASSSSSSHTAPPMTPPTKASRLRDVLESYGIHRPGTLASGSASTVLQSGKKPVSGGKGKMKEEVEGDGTPPPPSSPVKAVIAPPTVEDVVTAVKMELSEQQKAVKQMVLDGKSVFFTGSAGTGKSFLLREIIEALTDSGKKIAITATTGIAALNIHGGTLHAWAGIGLGKEPAFNLAKKVMNEIWDNKGKRWVKKGGIPFKENDWKETQVLVIDEISILDGLLFDKLNEIGMTVRNNSKPFGGIQIVGVGDFFQLPPVPDKGSKATFAFQAKSWDAAIPRVVVLNHVFRQKDDRFVNILNQMRVGNMEAETISALTSLSRSIVWEDGIYSELYPVNQQVNEANSDRLHALKGKLFNYPSVDYAGMMENGKSINHDHAKRVLDQSRARQNLQLKIGAVVMLLTNLGKPYKHLVNGSLGKIKCFESRESAARKGIPEAPQPKSDPAGGRGDDSDDDEGGGGRAPSPGVPNSTGVLRGSLEDVPKTFPVVHFIDGTELLFPPFNFEEQKWGKKRLFTEATRVQVPLMLAWALSVHKSQGQTLERVRVDLQRTFECGQAYVAISRCVSMESLQILNFSPSKVRAHPEVLKWMEAVQVEDV